MWLPLMRRRILIAQRLSLAMNRAAGGREGTRETRWFWWGPYKENKWCGDTIHDAPPSDCLTTLPFQHVICCTTPGFVHVVLMIISNRLLQISFQSTSGKYLFLCFLPFTVLCCPMLCFHLTHLQIYSRPLVCFYREILKPKLLVSFCKENK